MALGWKQALRVCGFGAPRAFEPPGLSGTGGIRPSPSSGSSTKPGGDQQPPWSCSGLSHHPAVLGWEPEAPWPCFPACLRGGETPSSVGWPESSSPTSQDPQQASSPGWLCPLPHSFELAVINDLLKSSFGVSNGHKRPFPAQKHRLVGTESSALLVPLLWSISGGCAQLTSAWTHAGTGHEPAESPAEALVGTVGLILPAQLVGEQGQGWLWGC